MAEKPYCAGIRRARALGLLLCFCIGAQAQQPIAQRGYDAGLSGANLSETFLNTSNVRPSTFGQVFALPVDDSIFAQPLYVPNVAIANQGTHNVVYVATMGDTLYAFDADVGGAPLWSVNFAAIAGTSPVPFDNFDFSGNQNIVGNLGILSTPIIDTNSGLLYLVACTLENGSMVYRLHAVDITSGAEPLGPGVVISGHFNGLTFKARYVTQRVSLALSHNQVVFAFGSVEEEYSGETVGWIMAYDEQALAQTGIFATNSAGNGAGVWQSGRPAVIDASGYVFLFTGNGYSNGYDGVHNFSESALKLDPGNGLQLVDWFTASDWSARDAYDVDLSSSGPMLLPGTELLAGGGKDGVLYLLDGSNLGKFNASDSQVVQKFTLCTNCELRGGPVYWARTSANGGPLFYSWGADDALKAYRFNGSTLATSPSAQWSNQFSWPGGMLALSANGSASGSGVLWATDVVSGDEENHPPQVGELHAFDAANVADELWNSSMNAARDSFGKFGKFVPPLVANGRVYVATWSNQVAVYGLLTTFSVAPTSLAFGKQPNGVASAPLSVTITNDGASSLSVRSVSIVSASPQPFSQTNNCGNSLAAGASCTVKVVFQPGASGGATGTLSIQTGVGNKNVTLSGTGVKPTFSLAPTSLSFGTQVINSASAASPITLTNTSSVSLTIGGISISNASSPGFSQTNNCGSSVSAGASCTISVIFTPTVAGTVSATLSVNGSAAGTQGVALAGTGGIPSYSLSPSSLTFGNQAVNVASAPSAVTLKNTGAVPLSIASIGLSTSGTQPFSQSNNCGTSLAAGASCTISLTFDPNAVGATTALLNVSVGGTPGSTSLSGTGTFQTTLAASAQSVTATVPITLSWSSAPNAACSASGGATGDNWGGTVPSSGSRSVVETMSGQYSYALNCTLQGVSTSALIAVAVTVPSVTLSASPSAVTLGQSVTLTWSAQHANTCKAGGGQSGDSWSADTASRGSAIVAPSAAGSISYTMTCASGPKSAVATATVNVSSAPSSGGSGGGGGGALDRVSLLALLLMLVSNLTRSVDDTSVGRGSRV